MRRSMAASSTTSTVIPLPARDRVLEVLEQARAFALQKEPDDFREKVGAAADPGPECRRIDNTLGRFSGRRAWPRLFCGGCAGVSVTSFRDEVGDHLKQ